MNTFLIYLSVAIFLIALLYMARKRKFGVPHVTTALASSVYSLSYESILGEYLGLYHYISREVSIPYMVVSGVLIYPVLNLIYLAYIPKGRPVKILLYAAFWIIAMHIYEMAAIAAGTIVLTGWGVFPWSTITYIVTYAWMTALYFCLRKH